MRLGYKLSDSTVLAMQQWTLQLFWLCNNLCVIHGLARMCAIVISKMIISQLNGQKNHEAKSMHGRAATKSQLNIAML